MSAITCPRLLGCAVALVLALGGCGGGHHSAGTAPGTTGAGQAPTYRFTGGNVPGTVYLGIGPASNSLDAYRLSGPLSKAERLTYSPWRFGINGRTALEGINGLVANGIYGLTANRRDVLITRVCCDHLGFIELLDLRRHGGLPGTVVGPLDPTGVDSIAPDGRFAHSVTDYRGCRCDVLLVRPSLFGRDRVVYRVPHPRRITGVSWGASNRLAILVGRPAELDTSTRDPEIVLDPGTSMQHTIQAAGPIDTVDGIWWGPRDEISYQINDSARVVVRQPTGQTRSLLVKDAAVSCWLPNDTLFTISDNKNDLGTLNPRTGAVTTIGHYPLDNVGAIFVLACPS